MSLSKSRSSGTNIAQGQLPGKMQKLFFTTFFIYLIKMFGELIMSAYLAKTYTFMEHLNYVLLFKLYDTSKSYIMISV